MAHGWLQAGSGDGAWDSENYALAQSEWQQGREFAGSAHEKFTSLAEDFDTHQDVRAFAEILQWISGLQWEMFDILIDATEVALDDDMETAHQLYDDGWAVILDPE